MLQRPYGPLRAGTSREERRGADDAGPDAGLEIAADPVPDLLGAALGLEALEVEAEPLGPLPEVGIVDAATLGIDGVDHLEEAALPPRRLGGGVQRRRPRVLAGDRKVAEDDPCPPLADLPPGAGAVWAGEVGVDDQGLALSPRVVLRTDRGDRGAGQVGGQAPADTRASKITLAPGISSGVGDSWTHSTMPSSSIRTSERLAWPTFSM